MLSIPYSNTKKCNAFNTKMHNYGSNKKIAAMYRHNFTALLYSNKEIAAM
jgi:hypothetical protein